MRKIMLKTICIFTLVFFVMSMTGAACGNGNCKTKTDAINDTYSIKLKSCPNTKYCFNVLSNDKGCNLKVTTCNTITTKLGGKVTIQSNGKACYKAPSKCSKKSCTDTFTYKIKGKDGKVDSAKVTLKLKCSTC